MNIVEAARVMTVLEETLADLRRISLITAPAMESIEELEDVFGREFSSILVSHRNASTKVQIKGHECLGPTTLSICRTMKQNPQIEPQLDHVFGEERSHGITELINILIAVKDRTYKRLTTTMEEENSEQDHFEEVCRREERAGKERQTLEQQLQLDRRERSKQVNHILDLEARSKSERELISSTSSQMATDLETSSKNTTSMDVTTFKERETFLRAEVDKLKLERETVEKDNREEELHLRSKKNKKTTEVEELLKVYDSEMSAKETAYQEEKKKYEELKENLARCEREFGELQEQAKEAREHMEKLREEKERKAEREKKMRDAAIIIQRAWRAHKSSGPAKKEDAGGKKGKKGKGAKPGKKKK
mmetsp:Transcript_7603/g.13085  ORF Transcript_7603/g.13085 Transcript_7603/m.13085 type:complete len:364 (-) Transcript_7603:224-1315(-)